MGKPDPSASRLSGRAGKTTTMAATADFGAARPKGRITLALIYGVLCHGLFAVGVGSMVLGMGFGMSQSFGTLTGWTAVVVNALLLLQFPICHSLLLSARGRAFLKRLAPADVASAMLPTTYVIVASIQLFLLFALWSPSGTVWWQAQGWVLAVMLVVYLASYALVAKSILDAGIGLQSGFIGWWAVLWRDKPQYPDMPTTGMFTIVRQPIYVSFALTTWTTPTWTPDQLAVALTFTTYCVLGPLFKEARFTKMYGARFAAYRNRVPYWVPFRLPR